MKSATALPVSRPTLLLLLAGTAGLVFAHSYPLTGWAYADWAAASAEARQGLALAGVWAAGCASWAASLHSSFASATCPIPALRNGAPLVRGQCTYLIGAAITGQAVGLTPAYLWCATNSTYAADLRPLVIISGATVLVASVALGYLCGVVLPRILATPAAIVGAFGAVALSGSGGSPLSPVWPFDVAAGLLEPSSVAVLRISFYLTTAGLCLLASARWLEQRRPSVPSVASAVLTAAPATLIVLLISANPPALVHRDTEAQARCAPAGDVQVCVHPARTALLPGLVRVVRSMEAVVGPGAELPARIHDATTWFPRSADSLPLHLQDEEPDQWQAAAALEVAGSILGTAGCFPDSRATGSSPGDVSAAAATWLASQIDPRAAALSRIGPADGLARRMLDAPPATITPLFRLALADLRACRAAAAALLPS